MCNLSNMGECFKRICEEYAEEKDFSGVCLAKKGEEVIFQGAYKWANRAFKILNQIDTKFDTASITKTFTAVAVLQLVEKGIIKLDDYIGDIIDLRDTKIPVDVKIEHLLNHTSGIADDADEEAGEEYSALFIDSPNYAIRECKDFLKNFAYKEANFRAGTAVRYNNCAFVLLGLAIEKVTGRNYRNYVSENVFDKAGMINTRFCAMDEINENTAEGYMSIWRESKDGKWKQVGFKKNIYSYPPIGTPDGGAYTTVGDLDRFIKAIQSNVLLNKKYSEMIFMPHCEFTKPSTWKEVEGAVIRTGYAFEFIEIKNKPFCIFKEGANDGVSAMLSYYPEADITLSLLANQNCDVWEMHRKMQTIIYDTYY